jgi:NAD+ diphosphatase
VTHFLYAGQELLVPAEAATGLGFDAPPEKGLAGAPVASRGFELDGEAFVAHMLPEGASPPGARGLPFRQALTEFPARDMRAPVRGLALLRWLEVARFCGACGSPLADKEKGGDDEGGRFCPACGRVFFPRISPAVIVLVRKGPRILLAHNARFKGGFFSLIAGFTEAGETLEETVLREVREEAGIEVASPRYVKSQPWPFPDSLMTAFVADWASGEARPDGDEITELRWCLPDELPELPMRGSVARSLIDAFVSGELSRD